MSFGAGFLTRPARRPSDGFPWGTGTLTLQFAGGPYRIGGLNEKQHTRANDHFQGLTGTDAPAPVEIQVLQAPPEAFTPAPPGPWVYTLELDPRPGAISLAGPGFWGHLAADGSSGRLWTAEAGDEPFVGVLENFFRVLVAYRLLDRGGVLLHSAGVVDGDRAWLFFGPSNAGKTTATRLSARGRRAILSDDLNAVTPAGPGLQAEKMPFAGDYGQNSTPAGPYPLAGLYRLHKGPAAGVGALSAAQALSALLACAPYVNADPHRQDRLLAVLQAICARVPVRALTFARDGDFWPILYQIDQD